MRAHHADSDGAGGRGDTTGVGSGKGPEERGEGRSPWEGSGGEEGVRGWGGRPRQLAERAHGLKGNGHMREEANRQGEGLRHGA